MSTISSKKVNLARVDPVKLMNRWWPHIRLYREQREIVYSVWRNDETFVPAANMMGKDFIGGLIVLTFFLTRRPCRIITTSVKDDHLRVLWGEINRFIQECSVPLDFKKGGPLIINHREIKRVVRGDLDSLSYLTGMVSEKGEGLQGHHIANRGDGIPRTLAVGDESSGLADQTYKMMNKWANRMLFIGNCWPCENFFKHAVKGKPGTEDRGGDIPRDYGEGFNRKVIRIKAEDSPNVRLGLKQKSKGLEPTDEVILHGVKSYSEYLRNRKMWDEESQCVGLDADWYEGVLRKMFPEIWLNFSEDVARRIRDEGKLRRARSIGIDPAEGGDSTVMTAIDEYGIIEQVSAKTPDTSVITGETLAFMRKHGVDPTNVVFDRGGGGKEHADRLRRQGFDVRTVAFGEAVVPEMKRGLTPLHQRKDEHEERTIYKNRRAEMYDNLRQLINPANGPGFGIPRECVELRRQLSVIPLHYDEEGKMYLPPKQKRANVESKHQSMFDLLGRSPDEADSTVLAVFGMVNKPIRRTAGAIK